MDLLNIPVWRLWSRNPHYYTDIASFKWKKSQLNPSWLFPQRSYDRLRHVCGTSLGMGTLACWVAGFESIAIEILYIYAKAPEN